MITTYITLAEATLLYPLASGTTNYSTDLKNKALSMSFGLVEDIISSQFASPIIASWNGESSSNPIASLELLQYRYFRWLLEFSNMGETEEAQNVKKAIDDEAQALRTRLVDISTLNYESRVGWRITEITNTGSVGWVEISGEPPSDTRHYKLKITSAGTLYVGNDTVQFSVFRDDNFGTALSTANAATYDTWQDIDSQFSVRWLGQWTLNDEVQITGTPRSAVNATGEPSRIIKSRVIS
jgi:hypothetical protein